MNQLLDPRDDPEYKNKTRAELYTLLVASIAEADAYRTGRHDEIHNRDRAEQKLKASEQACTALQNQLHDISTAIETALAMRHPAIKLPLKVHGYTPAQQKIQPTVDEESNLLLFLYGIAVSCNYDNSIRISADFEGFRKAIDKVGLAFKSRT